MPRNRNEEVPEFTWPHVWDEACIAYASSVARDCIAVGRGYHEVLSHGWSNAGVESVRTASLSAELDGMKWHSVNPCIAVAQYIEYLNMWEG